MTQKDTNEIIAKTMESEKEALFRYACCYLGDIEEAKDIFVIDTFQYPSILTPKAEK